MLPEPPLPYNGIDAVMAKLLAKESELLVSARMLISPLVALRLILFSALKFDEWIFKSETAEVRLMSPLEKMLLLTTSLCLNPDFCCE